MEVELLDLLKWMFTILLLLLALLLFFALLRQKNIPKLREVTLEILRQHEELKDEDLRAQCNQHFFIPFSGPSFYQEMGNLVRADVIQRRREEVTIGNRKYPADYYSCKGVGKPKQTVKDPSLWEVLGGLLGGLAPSRA